ncbi:glycosyltransferase [Selenomonas sp. oral taxon 149]|uniref:glycosyltransferase n=1 Tax=Selenomonas sp. oral taxon 149 TaxID=712535 RepID=UPI0001E0B783|nr:glycosyltransferase [Selenomonas sp. oral taxon 149]EFM23319.1 glycosyltransferase, group 2 family protein [Selenomonas sp. oral taxon 149 str. 67H29BP]
MNDRKIAVIAQCDPNGVSAIRPYIDALDIPNGYEVELIEVRPDGNVADTYQRAMEASDAKYKIYLAPGSILLRLNFFAEMLRVFAEDPAIGIMGLVGTAQLSTLGELGASPMLKGRLLYSDDTAFHGAAVERATEEVMAVSSDLIATQYDIPWRSDLFHSNCFFAEAQCIEFRRKGYRTVVPQQDAPWLLTRKRESVADEASRNVFLDTYSKDVYPLVSIVIPTFERPHYFRLALESVLAQTYRNLDIFITDNSHNTETADMMRRDFSSDPRIHYEHHPSYGAPENWTRARRYDNKDADYVNWLMDDDLFLPDKIEVMMDCFFAHPDLSLVTSYRELIDADGNKLPDLPATRPIVQELTKFSGETIGANILVHLTNFVGEPTTALLKKKFMLDGHDLGFSGREGKYLISDFPTWLCMLSQSNMMYFPRPLSQFRLHGGNEQLSVQSRIRGTISWALVIRHAIERNLFLHELSTRRMAIAGWLVIASLLLEVVAKIPEVWEDTELKDLLCVHAAMAEALRKDCRIDFDIDTTVTLHMDEG